MRRTVVIVVLLVLALACGAVAGEKAEALGVRFYVASIMSTQKGVDSEVPISVLETLASVESVKGVQFCSGTKEARLQIELGFTGLSAFTEWYRSDGAKELISELDEASSEPLEMKLEAAGHHNHPECYGDKDDHKYDKDDKYKKDGKYEKDAEYEKAGEHKEE